MRTHLMSLEMVNSSTAAMETEARTGCTAGCIAGLTSSPEAEQESRASIVGGGVGRRSVSGDILSFVFLALPPPPRRVLRLLYR